MRNADQDRQPQEEVDHVRQHGDDGQHLGREQDLLDEIAAGDEDVRRLEDRRREPGPRQDAAEQEQRVRVEVAARARGRTYVKTNV